jgi:chromosome segregation ATPase
MVSASLAGAYAIATNTIAAHPGVFVTTTVTLLAQNALQGIIRNFSKDQAPLGLGQQFTITAITSAAVTTAAAYALSITTPALLLSTFVLPIILYLPLCSDNVSASLINDARAAARSNEAQAARAAGLAEGETVQDLRAKIASLEQGDLGAARAEVAQLQGHITKLVTQLETTETELTTQLETAQAEAGKAAELQEQITELTTQLEAAQAEAGKAAELQEQITELATQLETAQTEAGKVAELQDQITELTSQLEAAQAEAGKVAEFQEQITELTTQLETAQGESARLREALEAAETKAKEATARIQGLKDSVAKKEAALEAATTASTDVEALRAKLAEVKANLQAATEAEEAAKAAVAEAHKAHKSWKARANEFESQVGDLTAQLKPAQAEAGKVSELQTRIAELTAQLEERATSETAHGVAAAALDESILTPHEQAQDAFLKAVAAHVGAKDVQERVENRGEHARTHLTGLKAALQTFKNSGVEIAEDTPLADLMRAIAEHTSATTPARKSKERNKFSALQLEHISTALSRYNEAVAELSVSEA